MRLEARALLLLAALLFASPANAQEPAAPQTAIGPAQAPVVLTVFSDFGCQPCGELAAVLQGLLEARPDKVRVIFRHAPVADGPSADAHLASLAAAEQGRFAEMHSVLFANQDRQTRADTIRMAEQIGLDIARFQNAITNPALAEIVRTDAADARRRGIERAPVVLLNDAPLPGPLTLEALLRLVDHPEN